MSRKNLRGIVTLFFVVGVGIAAGLLVVGRTSSVNVKTTPPPSPAPPSGLNPIQAENRKPGTTGWLIPPSEPSVVRGVHIDPQGYASRTSAVPGQRITLYLTALTRVLHVSVYRIGWYGGKAARLVGSFRDDAASSQPRCPTIAPTRLLRCLWRPSMAFVIPRTWVTGMYLMKLTDANGRSSYIPVVVRETVPRAPILYQAPVTTWQAYNYWGARDLYGGQCHLPAAAPGAEPSPRPSDTPTTGPSARSSSSPSSTAGPPSTEIPPERSISGGCFNQRSYAVSFDRPYGSGGAFWFLRYELSLVEWLERNGYDVGYATDIDTDLGLDNLRARNVIISAGHDEYWSRAMRDAVQRAIDRGTSVAFMGANDVFRRIRFEPSSLGPARVIVNYKSALLDPVARVDPANGTQNWDQGPAAVPVQPFVGAAYRCDRVAAAWEPTLEPSWLFAHTGFQRKSRIKGMIGPEIDALSGAFPRQRDEVLVAHSAARCPGKRAAADTTLYRASSGALVFDAGTLWFSCALAPDPLCPLGPDVRLQRLTMNLIDRMLGASNAARAHTRAAAH